MLGNPGFVYVLTSLESDCIKIGGSDYPPLKRIREINGTPVYRERGPWTLFDLRHVKDWQTIETSLHRLFADRRARDILGVDELFRVPAVEARRQLEAIDPHLLVGRSAIDKMFGDADFALYLRKLFAFAGLSQWRDIQGAWTLTLYPSTGRGRYFTINIGTHEVAFATLAHEAGSQPIHCVVVDSLIADFPAVMGWVERHGGSLRESPYASALPRAVSLSFEASFAKAEHLFAHEGMRRALIAYWSEALLRLHQKGSSSFFARFHNHNAVSAICRNLVGPGLESFA